MSIFVDSDKRFDDLSRVSQRSVSGVMRAMRLLCCIGLRCVLCGGGCVVCVVCCVGCVVCCVVCGVWCVL